MRIAGIPVKDLSRFGRNVVLTGSLIEMLLPSLDCRFIALNNQIDTLNMESPSNDVLGFLNLFNERVSKQTSQKVRGVKTMLARKGEFLGAYAPYGYKKDSENRHRLVVDKETASVVSRIFKMRRCGQSFRSIATTLNRERILSPRIVQCQRQGKEVPSRENGLWNESGVQSLIRNEVYIGNMVQNKRGTTTYRSRKLTAKEQAYKPFPTKQGWQSCQHLYRVAPMWRLWGKNAYCDRKASQ